MKKSRFKVSQISKVLKRVEEGLAWIRSVATRPLTKPKVAVVTRKLDVGGSERHLLQILPLLTKRFDVSLFVIHSGGKLEYAFAQGMVKVVGPPLALGRVLGRVWVVIRIAAFLALNRSAVVHFFLPEAYLIGGVCGAMLWHPRMVMSRRSLNVYQREHPFTTIIEKLLHKKMRIVIGNSNAVVTDLLDEGVPEPRLRLIYNGVNTFSSSNDAEQNTQRSRLGIADDEFVIIAVANLIPYKGHEDLIRAMASIAPQMPITWRLLLVGRDDGIQLALQDLIDDLSLSGHVRFIGQVDSVEPLLAMADIGVLPSHQEGFSNSVLEGMAAGLPMVVTNVGGNAEAVLHKVTGFVVPPHCPEKLGAAIHSLAVDPVKRELFGKAGRQRAEDVFSASACVKAYEELYFSISETDQ